VNVTFDDQDRVLENRQNLRAITLILWCLGLDSKGVNYCFSSVMYTNVWLSS
jgi:hypothetical protein